MQLAVLTGRCPLAKVADVMMCASGREVRFKYFTGFFFKEWVWSYFALLKRLTRAPIGYFTTYYSESFRTSYE